MRIPNSGYHVQRRGPNGRYYFRVRVPTQLIPAFRVKELRFSLRTRDLADATARADVIRQRLTLVLALGRTHVLTDEQIHDLLVGYVKRELERDEQMRTAGEELLGSVRDPGDILNTYRARIETLCDALIHADQQHALGGNYADFILRSNDLIEPEGSPGYLRLAREALKAQLEVVETQLSRFLGDYSNPYDSRFSYLS